MRKLYFVTGGALRRVFIDGRTVTLLTAELGYAPLVIELDKLDEPETKKKLEKAKMDEKLLKELSLLETEEELAKDITLDFQRTGWRPMKRE